MAEKEQKQGAADLNSAAATQAPATPGVSIELRTEVRFRALDLALQNGHSMANPDGLRAAVDQYEAIVLDEQNFEPGNPETGV